jgi:curved DNA-binding protein CbpA
MPTIRRSDPKTARRWRKVIRRAGKQIKTRAQKETIEVCVEEYKKAAGKIARDHATKVFKLEQEQRALHNGVQKNAHKILEQEREIRRLCMAAEENAKKKTPLEEVKELDIRIKLLHPIPLLKDPFFTGPSANFRIHFGQIGYIELLFHQEDQNRYRIAWAQELKFVDANLKKAIEARLTKIYEGKVFDGKAPEPEKRKRGAAEDDRFEQAFRQGPRPGGGPGPQKRQRPRSPPEEFVNRGFFGFGGPGRDPFAGTYGGSFYSGFGDQGADPLRGAFLPWGTLELDGPVDEETARSAYRKLAMVYHPDRSAPTDKAKNEGKMKKLNEDWSRIQKEMGWK